jgi:hypothetical protein
MNTVMDDNKMLTLASNERIPLTPSMRLLLEINHMVHCSPATVSRGGVIFVNAEDVGWKPVVDSWIEKLEVRHSSQPVPCVLRELRVYSGRCSNLTACKHPGSSRPSTCDSSIADLQLIIHIQWLCLAENGCKT